MKGKMKAPTCSSQLLKKNLLALALGFQLPLQLA